MSGDSSERVLAEGTLPNGAAIRMVAGTSLGSETLHQMIDLLKMAFGRWPAFDLPVPPIEHLRWKLAGPQPDSPGYATLVEMDGRLASMATTFMIPTYLLGRVLLIETGGDAATHPDFTRQGLNTQIRASRRVAGANWQDGTLSTSLNPSTLRRRERLAHSREPGNRPRVLARIYHSPRAAQDRRAAGSRIPWLAMTLGLAPLALWPALSGLVRRRSRDISTVPLERFDERFEELFEDCIRDFDLARVRSAQYLNWRFADPRAGMYRVFTALEGTRLLGYIVFRTSENRGYVVDMLVRPGRMDALDALLDEAELAFKRARVAVAICWLPGWHPYRRVLARRGFFDTRQPTGLTFESHARGDAEPVDPAFVANPHARWHFTLGDTDLI